MKSHKQTQEAASAPAPQAPSPGLRRLLQKHCSCTSWRPGAHKATTQRGPDQSCQEAVTCRGPAAEGQGPTEQLLEKDERRALGWMGQDRQDQTWERSCPPKNAIPSTQGGPPATPPHIPPLTRWHSAWHRLAEEAATGTRQSSSTMVGENRLDPCSCPNLMLKCNPSAGSGAGGKCLDRGRIPHSLGLSS